MTARTLFASLTLGLAVTITVSWAAALWSPLTGYTFLHPPPPAGSRLGLRLALPGDWTIRTCLVRRGPGLRHDTISESEWIGSALGAGPFTAPNRTLVAVSSGWPLPAMQWTEYDARRLTLSLYDTGIGFAGTRLPRREYPEAHLPLRPLWTGLALDTVLAATLACGASTALSHMRRARRRRRGRCTRCNYPLATLPTCPECGLQPSMP